MGSPRTNHHGAFFMPILCVLTIETCRQDETRTEQTSTATAVSHKTILLIRQTLMSSLHEKACRRRAALKMAQAQAASRVTAAAPAAAIRLMPLKSAWHKIAKTARASRSGVAAACGMPHFSLRGGAGGDRRKRDFDRLKRRAQNCSPSSRHRYSALACRDDYYPVMPLPLAHAAALAAKGGEGRRRRTGCQAW